MKVSVIDEEVACRPESPAERRRRQARELARQGLEPCPCPGCGALAYVETCSVNRPGEAPQQQRILRCASPTRRCPPRVLDPASAEPTRAATVPDAPAPPDRAICPVCTGSFSPRVANQKVCGQRECRREWKKRYMKGFWARQRQDLEKLRQVELSERTVVPGSLPLPVLVQHLSHLEKSELRAVLQLTRLERRRLRSS